MEYDLPGGWFVETNPRYTPARDRARLFVIIPATDGPFPYGLVSVRAEGVSPSPSETVVSSAETTIDGRPATVREVEATGYGLFPAGYRTYEYVVDWSPSGWLVMSVGGDPGPEFDARKRGSTPSRRARYVG